MLAAAFIPERIFSPYEAVRLVPFYSENHNNAKHDFSIPFLNQDLFHQDNLPQSIIN